MYGGVTMRVKKILLFFITIICSVTLADKGFAEDVKETSPGINKNAVTIRADDFQKINLRDTVAGDSETQDTATGLLGVSAISGTHISLSHHASEAFKVLSVVEKRVGDKRLIKKVKDKLPTLSEDRLHMLASLSERIADDKHSAKTDIAFLLLTTLIIFS
jgi:hypothetical protein